MTADLLRRAATKLREHANAASRGPWEMDGADGLVWPGCMGDPVSGSELLADGAFIALMHPPVALALAAAMDEVAFAVEVNPDTVHRVGYGELITCARGVLREPEVKA